MGQLTEFLDNLQALYEQAEAAIFGDENTSATHNGQTRDSLSKAIKGKFDALQAMVQGRLAYETKAAMDAAGAPPAGELAEVVGDSETGNNGLYYWSGSAWVKSPYDPIRTAEKKVALLDLSIKKTGFVAGVETKNLVDPDDPDLAVGYFPSTDTGNLQANASYTATGYIPIEENTEYALSFKHYVTFYDIDKSYISGSPSSGDTSAATVTSPAGAVYMRASSANNMIGTSFQIEEGTESTEFEPYQRGKLSGDNVLKESLPGTVIKNDSLDIEKAKFLGKSKNLFNKKTILEGHFMAGSNGNISESSTYDVSDYIPVTPATTYTGRGVNTNMRFHTFFNSDLQVIGGSDSSADTFVTPSAVAYVRVTITHLDLDSFQLEEGANQTEYESYGFYAGDLLFTEEQKQSVINSGVFSGKKLSTLGDSITQGGKWQPYLSESLGFASISNKGIGGTMVSGSSADAMWQDARINDIDIDTDVIIFMGGTNDWAQSVALGSLDDTDPVTTFYGALNTVFEKLATRFPYAHIFVNTTPYGELIDLSSRPSWPNGATNNNGHTTHDYAECVRRAAAKWGYYVIDVAARSGINRVNIAEYMQDDGGLLHPDDTDDVTTDQYNDSGARRIAQVIISELSSFKLAIA